MVCSIRLYCWGKHINFVALVARLVSLLSVIIECRDSQLIGENIMNVFVTNIDAKQCALEHCHVHRNKMLIEYAQLLSVKFDSVPSWAL